jgi:hypothetical protein
MLTGSLQIRPLIIERELREMNLYDAQKLEFRMKAMEENRRKKIDCTDDPTRHAELLLHIDRAETYLSLMLINRLMS